MFYDYPDTLLCALPAADIDLDALGDIVTVDEFAALMRWNRKTAYERVRKGEVPGVLPGRPYRIHVPTVLASVSTGQGRVPGKRGRS
jgi:excisionase family DNA binding protein